MPLDLPLHVRLADPMFESRSGFSTTGATMLTDLESPILGIAGATECYAAFTWPSKLLFTLLMMLGRLELFAILVLFVPAFWRSR